MFCTDVHAYLSCWSGCVICNQNIYVIMLLFFLHSIFIYLPWFNSNCSDTFWNTSYSSYRLLLWTNGVFFLLKCHSILFFVGCWCDPGYLSMGFRWWSQSFVDAQKSASCQMGWWCWIGIDCHCYRFACLLQSYLTMTTSADSTNIWKLTAGGRIVPRFQELSPEKLGKVSIFFTYFYFSNKEYARVKDVVFNYTFLVLIVHEPGKLVNHMST